MITVPTTTAPAVNKIGVILTALAGVVSLTSFATAQQLPGPAANGWFVLIGPTPKENGSANCMAIVVPESDLKGESWRKIVQNFKPQSTFGPYAAVRDATTGLMQSGWATQHVAWLWFASSGC